VKWILAAGLLIAVLAIAVSWYRGGDDGASDALIVGERQHRVIRAPREGAPLLVLLHARGGTPRGLVWPELTDALADLGDDAPGVLLVDGGDHSYFHDRDDFAWGTHILREAIPAARRRLGTDPNREAIGGYSMGGFGALDLARQRRFCAVGGHSPALWQESGETPLGAFDDAEDFERHDVIAAARRNPRLYRGAKVWLDAGDEDSFARNTILLGELVDSPAKISPGGHTSQYWRDHVDEYVQFYSRALKTCR
jgi:S-formylglutathione hydrolase FrmB